MKLKPSTIFKIAGLCGILIPVVAGVFISISIHYSPWFNFTENWLSDLAGNAGETPIWAARGFSSAIFNLGLVLSGFVGFLCVLIVRKIGILDTRLGKIGSLLLLIDMLSLAAIGVFPMTIGDLHDVPSFAFFLLVPISLMLIGIAFRNASEKKLGWFIMGLAFVSFCAFPLLFIGPPWGSNAIIELIPSISISIFGVLLGVSMLQNRFVFKE